MAEPNNHNNISDAASDTASSSIKQMKGDIRKYHMLRSNRDGQTTQCTTTAAQDIRGFNERLYSTIIFFANSERDRCVYSKKFNPHFKPMALWSLWEGVDQDVQLRSSSASQSLSTTPFINMNDITTATVAAVGKQCSTMRTSIQNKDNNNNYQSNGHDSEDYLNDKSCYPFPYPHLMVTPPQLATTAAQLTSNGKDCRNNRKNNRPVASEDSPFSHSNYHNNYNFESSFNSNRIAPTNRNLTSTQNTSNQALNYNYSYSSPSSTVASSGLQATAALCVTYAASSSTPVVARTTGSSNKATSSISSSTRDPDNWDFLLQKYYGHWFAGQELSEWGILLREIDVYGIDGRIGTVFTTAPWNTEEYKMLNKFLKANKAIQKWFVRVVIDYSRFEHHSETWECALTNFVTFTLVGQTLKNYLKSFYATTNNKSSNTAPVLIDYTCEKMAYSGPAMLLCLMEDISDQYRLMFRDKIRECISKRMIFNGMYWPARAEDVIVMLGDDLRTFAIDRNCPTTVLEAFYEIASVVCPEEQIVAYVKSWGLDLDQI